MPELGPGGSLISFPALLAVGYPALTANITNTVALCPGYVGGTIGYRPELTGQRGRVIALSATSIAGSLTGSVLLLASSPELFERGRVGAVERDTGWTRWAPLLAAQFVAAIYGACFGAGLGIMIAGHPGDLHLRHPAATERRSKV